MHFYRVIRFDGDEFPMWEATLDVAHVTLKRRGTDMPEARIELFDVHTDKQSVLGLLNGSDVVDNADGPLRTWCLTARKGLAEIPNGE